jgi:hypothetical protein
MATEIRMASYNPKDIAHMWSDATPSLACITNFVPLCKGIKSATANSIAVAMDMDGSGRIGDGSNEYIVYSYDVTSTLPSILTRSVNCGAPEAILGGSAPYTNVRNAAVGVPLFRYYNSTNVLISAPVSNANIPNIRRILITIVADTAQKDINTQQYKRIVYSTSVMVRNHGFSY